jgi:hypothetical protein
VDRLSQNQGAESTLAFLLALAEMQALQNTIISFKESANDEHWPETKPAPDVK